MVKPETKKRARRATIILKIIILKTIISKTAIVETAVVRTAIQIIVIAAVGKNAKNITRVIIITICAPILPNIFNANTVIIKKAHAIPEFGKKIEITIFNKITNNVLTAKLN